MTHGEVVVNVSELTKIDQFKLLNTINTDKEIQGCYMSDLLSWVMGHAKRGECWRVLHTQSGDRLYGENAGPEIG